MLTFSIIFIFSYIYQEGRSPIGSAIVRSRRQSLFKGNIENFLSNFDCSLKQSWEHFGIQIELLGGIKVSIYSSKLKDSPPCYIGEIKCASSEANVSRASEKVSLMASTLASMIHTDNPS